LQAAAKAPTCRCIPTSGFCQAGPVTGGGPYGGGAQRKQ
jgi:hypothetical protein